MQMQVSSTPPRRRSVAKRFHDHITPAGTARAALLAASLAGVAVAVAGPAAAQAPGGGGAMPPARVGVMEMHRSPVPRRVALPGRAVAFQQVEIRPRVNGVIERILYTPGATLKVGDPLFQLDDDSYAATVAADEAALAAATAQLPLAQAALDRAQRLKGSGYTEAEVETARSALAEAQATLESARAALDYARTELGWTTIRSPIEGVADVAAVSVGDLVTSAQSDALTTVTRLDPIYVDMQETSARILAVRRQIESGALTRASRLDARLTLETGEVYEGAGELSSPGRIVSTTTGTVTMRFQFANPRHMILPGMFLRGEVEIGEMQAFLVPQRATDRDRAGGLTAFVAGDDGTAKLVSLTEAGVWNNAWIVTAGLAEGDRLILDGLKSLTAGAKIDPTPSTLDENGLVKATAAEPSAAAAAAPKKD